MKPSNIRLMPILLIGCAVVALLASGCKKSEDDPTPANETFSFKPADDNQAAVQTALINMAECDTIDFSTGTFMFDGTLSLDGKTCVVIRGAGKDQTTLDWTEQTQGAQGFYVNNTKQFLLMDLTIKDPVGDGIKIKDSDGVSLINVGVVYSEALNEDNGAYGIYPVTCNNVYINGCYVRGASDAGIYVGQTKDAIVSNCEVEGNVAGIEIENCIRADVFNNNAHDNTGGILAFDLENLPVIPNGNTCRIFNNTIVNNSLRNFAPDGNTVSFVPVGTGIMILSYDNVEVFGNTITNNNIMGIGVVSMNTLKLLEGNTSPTYENDYDPYNYRIKIHDNIISRDGNYPADLNTSAQQLFNVYDRDGIAPSIIYDGFPAPENDNGGDEGICISEAASTVFADVHAENLFTVTAFTDITRHACDPFPASIAAVEVDAPGAP